MTGGDVLIVEVKDGDKWLFLEAENTSPEKMDSILSEEASYRKYWENSYFRVYPSIDEPLPDYFSLKDKLKESEVQCGKEVEEGMKEVELNKVEVNNSEQLLSKTVTENGSDVKKSEHVITKSKFSRSSGIKNIGNSCYISSSIQALKHTKLLWDFLNSYNEKTPILSHHKNNEIFNSFNGLMKQLKDDNQLVAPREFKRVISSHSTQFSGSEQSDTHEFLTFLIDRLHEELKSVGELILERTFYGTFKSTIQCIKCKHTASSKERFLSISLPIDNDIDAITIILYTQSNKLHVINLEYENEGIRIKNMREKIEEELMVNSLDVLLLIDNNVLFPITDWQTIGDIVKCKSNWKLYALETLDHTKDLLVKVSITKHVPPFFIKCAIDLKNDPLLLLDHIKKMITGETNKSILQNITFNITSTKSVEADNVKYISLELKTNIKPADLRQMWSRLPQKDIKLHSSTAPNYDTIYDCLAKFTELERLEGNNQWLCGKCKELQDANKLLRYLALPEVLIIHLKRFKVIGKKARKKISSLVEFPIILLLNTIDNKRHMYGLYGIINHIGDMESGHYTIYCRNLKKRSEWLEFDDHRVKSIKDTQLITEKAYVLFYQHI
jgi:ubiquitin C-terminal hydrolase